MGFKDSTGATISSDEKPCWASTLLPRACAFLRILTALTAFEVEFWGKSLTIKGSSLGQACTATKAGKASVSPTRDENYAEWYQAVLKAADLAEQAPARGCGDH